MLNKEQQSKVIEILNNNTRFNQILVALEELSELQKALIKYERDLTISNIRNIEEELADVKIICQEIQFIYNIDNDVLMDKIDYKLDRELKRIVDKNS